MRGPGGAAHGDARSGKLLDSAAPSRRLGRFAGLLTRRVGGAQVVAVVAGLGLVVLASALEHGFDACLARTATVVPLAMPLLVAVGSWGAARRAAARGELRALAAMGHGTAAWTVAGALLGGALAFTLGGLAVALAVPVEGWVRGAGGWWYGGVAVPDVPGGLVGAASGPSFAWERALAWGFLGGGVGAAAGCARR